MREMKDELAAATRGKPPLAWTLFRIAPIVGIAWAACGAEAGVRFSASRALGIMAGLVFGSDGALLALGIRDSVNRTMRWVRGGRETLLSRRPPAYWRFNGLLYLFIAAVAFRVALFP